MNNKSQIELQSNSPILNLSQKKYKNCRNIFPLINKLNESINKKTIKFILNKSSSLKKIKKN